MDNELKDLQEYILPIVKDEELLRVKSEEVTTEEGEAIAVNLLTTLAHEQGVGLAAPQIGINKRVVAINVVEPFVLINPKIVEATGEVNYIEGCLSFPGKEVKTKRYTSIVVECDNYEGQFCFTARNPENPDIYKDDRLLECVAVQHEIDHLDGVLMFDRKRPSETVKLEKKVGRNEPCPCGSGKKYKKCCGKL